MKGEHQAKCRALYIGWIIDFKNKNHIFLGLHRRVVTVLKILTDSKSLKFEVAADKVLLLKGFSKEKLCRIPGLYVHFKWLVQYAGSDVFVKSLTKQHLGSNALQWMILILVTVSM